MKAQFEQLENEMKDSNVNFEAMKKGLLELTELKHILKKTQVFFEEVSSSRVSLRWSFIVCACCQVIYTIYNKSHVSKDVLYGEEDIIFTYL